MIGNYFIKKNHNGSKTLFYKINSQTQLVWNIIKASAITSTVFEIIVSEVLILHERKTNTTQQKNKKNYR